MVNTTNEFIADICGHVEKLFTDKGVWNAHWQDISDLVFPERSGFFYTQTPGEERRYKIFDSTAPWALIQAAAGLHTYLTNPSERWFEFTVPSWVKQTMDEYEIDELDRWLEDTVDVIYGILNNEKVNFTPQIHELYLDLLAYGTAILYVEEDYAGAPARFCTYHLANCAIAENRYGEVDVLARKFKMTARQALQQWPDFPSTKFREMAAKKPLDEHEFVQFVAPRKDFTRKRKTNKQMPWASWYIYPNEKILLSEGGYNKFPYMVPRWTKSTGETYGRSAAMTVLPDIRMINAMAATIIKTAQKQLDPPLMVPDEGFLLPIRTSPGSLLFYNSAMSPDQRIMPLEITGNHNLGLDLYKNKADAITKGFFLDLMQMEEGPQKTATEVMQRVEERMRLMGPAIARQRVELLDKMIDRLFDIAARRKMLPPMPQGLTARNVTELQIRYVSPAFRAMQATQVLGLQRLLETIGQIAPVKPDIVDPVSSDDTLDFLVDAYNVPKKVILPKAEVKRIRDERAAAQKAAADVQNAQIEAGAVKDTATGIANIKAAYAPEKSRSAGRG